MSQAKLDRRSRVERSAIAVARETHLRYKNFRYRTETRETFTHARCLPRRRWGGYIAKVPNGKSVFRQASPYRISPLVATNPISFWPQPEVATDPSKPSRTDSKAAPLYCTTALIDLNFSILLSEPTALRDDRGNRCEALAHLAREHLIVA